MIGYDTTNDNLPDLHSSKRPVNYVGVKAPMFSYTRLRGADPMLGNVGYFNYLGIYSNF